jgi:hypothetical protein
MRKMHDFVRLAANPRLPPSQGYGETGKAEVSLGRSAATGCNLLQLAVTGCMKKPQKGSKGTKCTISCDWLQVAASLGAGGHSGDVTEGNEVNEVAARCNLLQFAASGLTGFYWV